MENYLLLVKQAKGGDTKAFAELYETVYEDMYRFALYTLRNPEDAKDVVSDTVLDAFASIGKLKSEESFRYWIFKILSNKCKRMLGTYQKRERQMTEEMAETITYTGTDGKEVCAGSSSGRMDEAESAAVRSLFFQLPEEDRVIISMHLFGGYTSREMSVLLGMNENTLRSRESRALKKLALWLQT